MVFHHFCIEIWNRILNIELNIEFCRIQYSIQYSIFDSIFSYRPGFHGRIFPGVSFLLQFCHVVMAFVFFLYQNVRWWFRITRVNLIGVASDSYLARVGSCGARSGCCCCLFRCFAGLLCAACFVLAMRFMFVCAFVGVVFWCSIRCWCLVVSLVWYFGWRLIIPGGGC